ncbi:acyl carrier protein [Xenorhabdus sp. PB62.4]|uniref:acyl carrier protein n=1 Tax=Xenorhabdus sp. PB62.4 TaxID=1851573 RepID=UPI00165755E1|nr:acyl carrier protein [Xenorhabdus sp. PB62.4]MBC8953950.1 acyl carrier protein AcpC [Xenorhabdus sp. PB62.4]
MITKEYIEVKIAHMLKDVLELEVTPELIEDNLRDGFNIDSVSALELLVRIEQDFHIQIPDEELSVNLLNSFTRLVDYVEYKYNQN